MKNSSIDSNVGRKEKIINDQKNKKIKKSDFLPSIIEFSSSGLCNRKCIFCPRSDPNYEHLNSHLTLNNIEKLSDELSEYKKDFYFLFSGFSEPLLTKNLEDLINKLRENHPTSTIEINTNTDLLTKKELYLYLKVVSLL